MPKVNLNNIRTGNRQVDRAISAARQAIANPAAASTIVQNELQNVINGIGNQIPGASDVLRNLPMNPAIMGELAPLYTSKARLETPLLYPDDLDEDHYMTFRVIKTVRDGIKNPKRTQTTRFIALPIPANLQVAYGADYENASLGLMGGLASGDVSVGQVGSAISSAVDAAMNVGKSAMEGIKDSINGNATDASKGVQSAIAGIAGSGAATLAAGKVAGFVGAALGAAATAPQVAQGLSKRFGLAVNPHMAVIFKGVNFKEHQFSFKFIARSEKESRQIQAICKVFRKHMLPSYAGAKLAFKYPDEFLITFSPSVRPFLYNIGTCVLKSFNVTYNGGGVPQFFASTHAPVEVDITLGFQEVHIETSEGKDEETSGFGNGGDSLLTQEAQEESVSESYGDPF